MAPLILPVDASSVRTKLMVDGKRIGCILHRFDCNENEYTSTTSEDIMNKIMMKRRSTYRIIILIASTPSRDED